MQTQPGSKPNNPNRYSSQSKPQPTTNYSPDGNLEDGALDTPEGESVASTAIVMIVVAALAVGVVWFASAYYKNRPGTESTAEDTAPVAASAPDATANNAVAPSAGTTNTNNNTAVGPVAPDMPAPPAANSNAPAADTTGANSTNNYQLNPTINVPPSNPNTGNTNAGTNNSNTSTR
jgi:cytoskeletal protein RodZ